MDAFNTFNNTKYQQAREIIEWVIQENETELRDNPWSVAVDVGVKKVFLNVSDWLIMNIYKEGVDECCPNCKIKSYILGEGIEDLPGYIDLLIQIISLSLGVEYIWIDGVDDAFGREPELSRQTLNYGRVFWEEKTFELYSNGYEFGRKLREKYLLPYRE